jgi:hypothetical protein
MYKYKVSGKVEVSYSIDFSLYEKLYNLYYEYICFEKAIKSMVFELNNEFNQEVLATKLKSRYKTLQKSCSISDLSDTFPANFISRTIYISDYEMTSAKEDLSEFRHEAEYKIHNMLMGILKIPHCRLIDTKVYITNIEDITKD